MNLYGEDAENDNARMRAIDDLASEPSARYFYKGFNEIVHDENTVIELLEKDFILAAGNKETCKRIGEV